MNHRTDWECENGLICPHEEDFEMHLSDYRMSFPCNSVLANFLPFANAEQILTVGFASP